MAVFAGLSEAVSAAALPFIDSSAQDRLIWFVTLFPSVLVVLFFLTLWVSPRKLYGPGDYKTDEAFLAAQGTIRISEVYAPASDTAQKLRNFWKPGGIVNEENAKALQDWLRRNEIGIDSITLFLTSQDYKAQRERAVADLRL
jgi:hypothetical protein